VSADTPVRWSSFSPALAVRGRRSKVITGTGGPLEARLRLVEERQERNTHGLGLGGHFTVAQLLLEIRRDTGEWNGFFVDGISHRAGERDLGRTKLLSAPDGERLLLRVFDEWPRPGPDVATRSRRSAMKVRP
jgi:hypothetical protein